MENSKTLEPISPLKKSTLFLQKQADIKETFDGYKIELGNGLPDDYQAELENLTYGIFNGNREDIVEGAELSDDGKTISVKGDLKPGHYFINIRDKNGKYPSFNQEWSAFSEYSYPYFHFMNNDPVTFKRGKIQSPSMSVEDLRKNIEEIEITDAEGKMIYDVPFRDEGSDLDGKFINEEYRNNQLFDAEGKVNPDFKKDGRKIFEEGKKYNLHVHFWTTTATLDTPYDLTENTRYDDKFVKYGYNHESGSTYNIKLKVTLSEDGETVKSVEDFGTVAGRDFADRWVTFVKEKKGLELYNGKSFDEIKAFKAEEGFSYPFDEISMQTRGAVIDALNDGRELQPETLTEKHRFVQKDIRRYEAGYKIVFDNTLPSSYDVEIESVYYGPSDRGGKKIENYTFNKKKNTLSITGDLQPGFYYVNIKDKNGKYGEPVKSIDRMGNLICPSFVINDAGLPVKFNTESNKLEVESMDISDAAANFSSAMIIGDDFAVLSVIDNDGNYVEKYKENPFFLEDGRLNFAIKDPDTGKNIFKTGKDYDLQIYFYGITPIEVKLTAPDVEIFEKRITGEKELREYLKPENYREKGQLEIKELLEQGKIALEKADSETAVNEVIRTVKEKLDKVKTDEAYKKEELAAAKREAEPVEKLIHSLGSPETIRISDKEKIKNAEGEYNKLSEPAKAQITGKALLDRLTAEIERMENEASFKVEVNEELNRDNRLEAENDTYTYVRGKSENLVLTVEGAESDDFTGLYADGEEVKEENYTAESESIIITLKKEFMNTLEDGSHRFRILSDRGFGEITVNIKTKMQNDAEENDSENQEFLPDGEITDKTDKEDIPEKKSDIVIKEELSGDKHEIENKHDMPDKMVSDKPGNSQVSKKTESRTVLTGDRNNLLYPVIALVIAVAALIFLLKKIKKH